VAPDPTPGAVRDTDKRIRIPSTLQRVVEADCAALEISENEWWNRAGRVFSRFSMTPIERVLQMELPKG
jgi:hypothetical protein